MCAIVFRLDPILRQQALRPAVHEWNLHYFPSLHDEAPESMLFYEFRATYISTCVSFIPPLEARHLLIKTVERQWLANAPIRTQPCKVPHSRKRSFYFVKTLRKSAATNFKSLGPRIKLQATAVCWFITIRLGVSTNNKQDLLCQLNHEKK